MNDTRNHATLIGRAVEGEALQARFARQVTACLTARSEMTPHHVDERLRVARERALDHARARRAALGAPGPVVLSGDGGAATLALGSGPGDASWWLRRLGMLLPLLALVAGLVLIQHEHARLRTAAVADVDVDLLVDDLPPTAYSDPGFVAFLKTAARQ